MISKTPFPQLLVCVHHIKLSSPIFDHCQQEDLATHQAIASCISALGPDRLNAKETATYPVRSTPQTVRQGQAIRYHLGAETQVSNGRVQFLPPPSKLQPSRIVVLPNSIIGGEVHQVASDAA